MRKKSVPPIFRIGGRENFWDRFFPRIGGGEDSGTDFFPESGGGEEWDRFFPRIGSRPDSGEKIGTAMSESGGGRFSEIPHPSGLRVNRSQNRARQARIGSRPILKIPESVPATPESAFGHPRIGLGRQAASTDSGVASADSGVAGTDSGIFRIGLARFWPPRPIQGPITPKMHV